MKLCINCKHSERDMWCVSPANGLSPVDGRPNPSFASVNRGTSVLANCGPDAVHFDEKLKIDFHASMAGSFVGRYEPFPKPGIIARLRELFAIKDKQ